MNIEFLDARQDEAITIHSLALAADDLLDLVRADQSPALSGLRAVMNVIIEKADDLQRKLDRMNMPKE